MSCVFIVLSLQANGLKAMHASSSALCKRNSTVRHLGQELQVSLVPVAAFSTAAFEVYRLPAMLGAIQTEDDVLLDTSVFTRLTCNTGTDSHFSIPLIA